LRANIFTGLMYRSRKTLSVLKSNRGNSRYTLKSEGAKSSHVSEHTGPA
jgi:hypothetical protein